MGAPLRLLASACDGYVRVCLTGGIHIATQRLNRMSGNIGWKGCMAYIDEGR